MGIRWALRRQSFSAVSCAPSTLVGLLQWLPVSLASFYINIILELQCIAYSPPSILDPLAAAFCESFVVSLVVGHDMAPRLSMRSLLRLRHDMLSAMRCAKTPKWRILAVTTLLTSNSLILFLCTIQLFQYTQDPNTSGYDIAGGPSAPLARRSLVGGAVRRPGGQ